MIECYSRTSQNHSPKHYDDSELISIIKHGYSKSKILKMFLHVERNEIDLLENNDNKL